MGTQNGAGYTSEGVEADKPLGGPYRSHLLLTSVPLQKNLRRMQALSLGDHEQTLERHISERLRNRKFRVFVESCLTDGTHDFKNIGALFLVNLPDQFVGDAAGFQGDFKSTPAARVALQNSRLDSFYRAPFRHSWPKQSELFFELGHIEKCSEGRIHWIVDGICEFHCSILPSFTFPNPRNRSSSNASAFSCQRHTCLKMYRFARCKRRAAP